MTLIKFLWTVALRHHRKKIRLIKLFSHNQCVKEWRAIERKLMSTILFSELANELHNDNGSLKDLSLKHKYKLNKKLLEMIDLIRK